MKKILLILSLFPILVFSQKSYKIPADSTILNNIGSGKNELVIRNATSNITGGVLTNLGNGVTAFVLGGGSARVVDTIYKNSAKDSIVFTISGIRYAVKDSSGGSSQTLSLTRDTLSISNGNSLKLPSLLFPNGAKLVETDRTLQADDAGYALLLSDGVQLTIPTICPLSPGQYFGISTNSATASFISEGAPSEFAVYLSYPGQGAALVNEVVTYVAADVGGSTSLILLTQIAGSNDTIMTANRYFFEQSKNKIPLNGTEAGNPVTGDISYGVLDGSQKKINYTNADGLEEGIILGGDGSQYEAGVKNGFVTNFLDTSYSFVATGSSSGAIIGSFNPNRGTQNYIAEIDNVGNKIGFVISNNYSGATGLSGGQDFTANITDLDYTQKIYVDQRISDTATQIRSEIPNVSNFATITNLADTSALLRGLIPQTLTFSTGLTNTSSTITNNLSTGVSGGQSVIGGTASGENLTLSSTSNATKGDLRFGTSAYKEVNNRLGIGTTSPQTSLHIYSTGSGNSTGQEILRLASAANGNGNGPRIQFTDNDNTTFTSAIRSAALGSSNTGLIFSTGYGGSTDAVIINGKGNYGVGIGLGSLVLPTARLHLGAGTATANTAPIKLTEGTKLATPETGTLEFVTGRFVIQSDAITMGTSAGDPSSLIDIQSTTKGFLPPRMTTTQRDAISSPATGLSVYNTTLNSNDSYDGTRWTSGAKFLTATATLDFGNTAAGTVSDLTITVTGAADGDAVMLGVPNASIVAAGSYSAWVSATNTVTVRYANNALVTAYDPASGTFKLTVNK